MYEIEIIIGSIVVNCEGSFLLQKNCTSFSSSRHVCHSIHCLRFSLFDIERRLFKNFENAHCVKSVQIWSFCWSVLSCIRTEYRKIRTSKNSVFGHLSRSGYYIILFQLYDHSKCIQIAFPLVFPQIHGSSCPEVFCKKGVLRNFAKFTGTHLCQSLFFGKIAGLRPATLLNKETLAQVFSCEFWEISKNTFFTGDIRCLLLNNCRMIPSCSMFAEFVILSIWISNSGLYGWLATSL